MACANWPDWAPSGSGTSARTLLMQIVFKAGSNPAAAAAKAAAQQALVTTTPATSQLHDCAYYYNLVVAARADAESGLWDACAIALGQVDSE